jgi:hypothetical protein
MKGPIDYGGAALVYELHIKLGGKSKHYSELIFCYG